MSQPLNATVPFEHTVACEVNGGAGGTGTGEIVASNNTADDTFFSNVDAHGTTEANIPDQFNPTFEGLTIGTADAGQGPGSGFAITSLAGTGTSTNFADATGHPQNNPADPGALQVNNDPTLLPVLIEIGGEVIEVNGTTFADGRQTFTGCVRSVNGAVKNH